MPTALAIQHADVEEPYAVADALARAGVGIDLRRVCDGDALPETLDAHDVLVVMGGPMAADDDAGFPTRRRELALLADALDRGLPTLGICLGAQLLAAAGGGMVRRGDGPEVGWGPVTVAPAATRDPLFAGVPGELIVLHWHGDTLDLPATAVLLASSPRYRNQAFRVGPAAWGCSSTSR